MSKKIVEQQIAHAETFARIADLVAQHFTTDSAEYEAIAEIVAEADAFADEVSHW